MLNSPTVEQRALMKRAAWLFLLAMITGAWAGVVMTQGKAIGLDLPIHPRHERLVLAAHLNGLLGTFWILGVMITLDATRLSEAGRAWLKRLTLLAAYGNWLVTLIASFLDVRGLAFDSDAKNNLIAGLLQVFVVIPTLTAAALWVVGLSRKDTNS